MKRVIKLFKDTYVYNTASKLVSYENKEIKNNIEEIILEKQYQSISINIQIIFKLYSNNIQ